MKDLKKIEADEFEDFEQQNKKGFLKNSSKTFKMAICTFATTLVAMVGVGAAVGNIALASYPNNSQIVTIAKELDCDTVYINSKFNKFAKMEHNGKDPIYVCFDEDLNELEKDSAIKALDYLFGIVGKINSNYRYEIVDKSTFNLTLFKTKIYFEIGKKVDEESMSGDIDISLNPLSFLTSKLTMYNYTVHQNRTAYQPEEEELVHLYVHELFHAFGISDVYLHEDTEKHQGNTFIKPSLGRKVGILTPNDVKCLMALYAEKFENEVEQNTTISNYKKIIEEYEDYYYNYFADEVRKDFQVTENITRENFYWQGYGSYKNNYNQSGEYFYKIRVENGKYTFNILDTQNNLLDTCTGEACNINGVVILKNVELKEGIAPGLKGNPNGFIQDFVMTQEKGLITLRDLQGEKEILGFTSNIIIENQLD